MWKVKDGNVMDDIFDTALNIYFDSGRRKMDAYLDRMVAYGMITERDADAIAECIDESEEFEWGWDW